MTGEKHSKVYIEVVNKLREMITADGLKAGDKLPSERELTERLNVGRSSVREALRSLELLGVIETRRGEGTFIRDYQDHQLVNLLSTFILQSEKAKKELIETKNAIEMVCLLLFLRKTTTGNLMKLKEWLKKDKINDDVFFSQLIQLTDNDLLLNMWLILKDYYHSFHSEEVEGQKRDYDILIEALEANDEEKTLSAYRRLRKVSIF